MAAALSAGSPSDLQMRCLGATLGKLPRDTASGAVWYKASHNNSAGGRILKRSLDFSLQYASFEKKVTLLLHLEKDLLVYLSSPHH